MNNRLESLAYRAIMTALALFLVVMFFVALAAAVHGGTCPAQYAKYAMC